MKYDIDFYKDYLKNELSKDRYEHSLAVANLAKELASYHNVDVDKAYFAGLVHDIAKEKDDNFYNDIFIRHHDNDKVAFPFKTKHSFCAKYLLMDDFNIVDEDILDAVYNHTILNSSKDISKIVYIADKRDATRNINDNIVEVAKNDLDKAVNMLIESFKVKKENKKLEDIKNIIDKKFGDNLVVLDFRNKNPYIDYAFVCTVKNSRIASSIIEELSKYSKFSLINIYGFDSNSDEWQYIDMGEIVVHIFINDARKKYDLDGLWKDLIMNK